MLRAIINKIMQAKIKWGGVKLCGWNNHIDSPIIRRSSKAEIVIREGFSIRNGAILNVSDCGKLYVGENVFINNGTKINVRDSVTIGAGCIIGQDVLVYDHDHDYRSVNRQTEFKTAPIKIGQNVWIGSNVIILKGVVIGDNSVVAAGSIVNCDIPENTLFFRKLSDPQMRSITEC